jgi:ABC-2 type transport system permease protein
MNHLHPKRIVILIRKEWAELYKNTMLLGTVLFMPLLFAAIPIIMLWSMGDIAEGMGDVAMGLPKQMMGMCGDLSAGACSMAFLLAQFNMMFMFIPIILPATIIPYAIVGEKTQRSLEPLLATPISTIDLLLAKSLAAIIPAVLATWLAFGVYAIATWLLLTDQAIFAMIFQPHWLFAIFILGPLLALLTASLALMVSARSNEPRSAQQVASLVLLPVVMLLIGQISGMFFITPAFTFLLGAIVLLLDIALAWLAVKVFDREAILTRWA